MSFKVIARPQFGGKIMAPNLTASMRHFGRSENPHNGIAVAEA
jgi:hypothetical protein